MKKNTLLLIICGIILDLYAFYNINQDKILLAIFQVILGTLCLYTGLYGNSEH